MEIGAADAPEVLSPGFNEAMTFRSWNYMLFAREMLRSLYFNEAMTFRSWKSIAYAIADNRTAASMRP